MKPSAVTSALTLEDARQAIRRCNSYSRLPAIIDLAYRMEDWDWLTLLGDNWEICDNIAQCADDLFDLTPFAFLAEAPDAWRDAMMTKRERAVLARLPETLTIYRGCYATNKRGMSWTLRPKVAERFPLTARYSQPGQPLLVRANLKRADVLALKLGRREAEIIAPPWSPKIRGIRHIKFHRAIGP